MLEECYGSAKEMKERVKKYREGGAKEMGVDDGIEIESDDEFGEFDAVSQLVEEFVSLDDLMNDAKKRKVEAEVKLG